MTSDEPTGSVDFGEGLSDLRQGLRHPDEDIAQAAVLEVTVIDEPHVNQLLLEALKLANHSVRQIAADSLAELATDETIESLAEMLRLEYPAVRTKAMELLVRLANRSLPAMQRLLSDEVGDVRILACTVLGNIGDRVAFDSLRSALSDPLENVRYAAAEALGKARAAGVTTQFWSVGMILKKLLYPEFPA